MKKDVYHVSAEGLVGKVKEVIRDANVKRIVVKDEKGSWRRGHAGSGAMACSSGGYHGYSDQVHPRS
jgi:hypothetical protein